MLAFQSELDELLNPGLFYVRETGNASLTPSELVRHIEAVETSMRVTTVMPPEDANRSARVYVEAVGSSPLLMDDLFVHPATGEILGGRLWGAFRLDRPHLIPFIYRLHYTLHLPGIWGVWLMGGISLGWMVGSLVGFWLTLPKRRPIWAKWRTAWGVKRGGSFHRRTLDIHRAPGLWLWPLFFLLAITGVAFNLREEVYRPVLTALLPTTPAFINDPRPASSPLGNISWGEALTLARTVAKNRGWIELRVERINLRNGYYEVRFVSPHIAGAGSSSVYVASDRKAILSVREAGSGQPGDIVDDLIYPIHSGQIAGLPGRILICITGLVVALLSVTGVIIWWKKRKPRVARQRMNGKAHARDAIHD